MKSSRRVELNRGSDVKSVRNFFFSLGSARSRRSFATGGASGGVGNGATRGQRILSSFEEDHLLVYIQFTDSSLQTEVRFRFSKKILAFNESLMGVVSFGWYSMYNEFRFVRFRPESDFLDSAARLSPGIRERRIIAEHQKQLEREIQQMHDTVRRNALRRRRPCNVWDSNSLSSWNSSIDSIAGTISLRRYRAPIWDVIKGYFISDIF